MYKYPTTCQKFVEILHDKDENQRNCDLLISNDKHNKRIYKAQNSINHIFQGAETYHSPEILHLVVCYGLMGGITCFHYMHT